MRIVLAGEPRGKGRPRFAPQTGRAYTDANTRNYESQLAWAAQTAMRGDAPLLGPLRVTVTAFVSIPKSFSRKKYEAAREGDLRPTTKPDADNIAKMLDALNKIVWQDDSQIVRLVVEKFYSESPRLEIDINILTDCF